MIKRDAEELARLSHASVQVPSWRSGPNHLHFFFLSIVCNWWQEGTTRGLACFRDVSPPLPVFGELQYETCDLSKGFGTSAAIRTLVRYIPLSVESCFGSRCKLS